MDIGPKRGILKPSDLEIAILSADQAKAKAQTWADGHRSISGNLDLHRDALEHSPLFHNIEARKVFETTKQETFEVNRTQATTMDEAYIKAVEAGDTELAKEFIAQGALLTAQDSDGANTFEIALANQDRDMIRVLSQDGLYRTADLNKNPRALIINLQNRPEIIEDILASYPDLDRLALLGTLAEELLKGSRTDKFQALLDLILDERTATNKDFLKFMLLHLYSNTEILDLIKAKNPEAVSQALVELDQQDSLIDLKAKSTSNNRNLVLGWLLDELGPERIAASDVAQSASPRFAKLGAKNLTKIFGSVDGYLDKLGNLSGLHSSSDPDISNAVRERDKAIIARADEIDRRRSYIRNLLNSGRALKKNIVETYSSFAKFLELASLESKSFVLDLNTKNSAFTDSSLLSDTDVKDLLTSIGYIGEEFNESHGNLFTTLTASNNQELVSEYFENYSDEQLNTLPENILYSMSVNLLGQENYQLVYRLMMLDSTKARFALDDFIQDSPSIDRQLLQERKVELVRSIAASVNIIDRENEMKAFLDKLGFQPSEIMANEPLTS